MKNTRRSLLIGLCWLACTQVGAEPVHSWRAEGHGVEIKVSVLKPEQSVAFYQARGFAKEDIAPYIVSCGFAFELRNVGKDSVRLRLADWQAVGKSGSARFRLADEWDAEWARRGVAESARIAFRWAQFQAEQDFAPGDWIMGMAVLEHRLADPFRLIFRFYNNNRQHEIAIDNVSCAPID